MPLAIGMTGFDAAVGGKQCWIGGPSDAVELVGDVVVFVPDD
jgi:hypothetical protein